MKIIFVRGITIISFLVFLLSSSSIIQEVQRIRIRREQKGVSEGFGNYQIIKNIAFHKYEKQIVKVLSYFPELQKTSIEFHELENKFPLYSRPKIFSLFIPFCKRKYLIAISKKSLPLYKKFLLKEMPYKAQVGVLGHELSHTLYYESKNSLEVVFIGIRYLLSASYRKRFERYTDGMAIKQGLGDYLLSWRNYFESMKEFRGFLKEGQSIYFEDRYLNANEIKKLINGNS